MSAVQTGDIKLVKDLIKQGANVNMTTDMSKTPLMFTEKPEIAQILIDNGANVNAQDAKKYTPLMYKRFGQHMESMDLKRL